MNIVAVNAKKMIVVVDQAGNIRKAVWDSERTAGAPTQAGIVLKDGELWHEVDVPEELYRKDRPALSEYYLQTTINAPATLLRRSKK
jgi:hypothetical protein